ncbi:MAG TPA: FAD-dependent oxidoreductase [Propionibacteriaceae bacterium]
MTSAVIVGAGVAGLACAYELSKHGISSTVLEASGRPGGRVWTLRRGDRVTDVLGRTQVANFREGSFFEAGAARVPVSHLTVRYFLELGIDVEFFSGSTRIEYFHLTEERKTHFVSADRILGEILALGIRSQADLSNAVEEAIAMRGHHSDAAHYVRRLTGETSAQDTRRRPFADLLCDCADHAALYGPILARFLPDEAGDPTLIRPRAGMSTLTSKLLAQSGTDLRLGVAVEEIEERVDSIRVVARDQATGEVSSIDADFCVSTVGPHELLRIRTGLPFHILEELSHYTVRPASKLALEFDSRWWESEYRGFGAAVETSGALERIWFPSQEILGDGGVVTAYYNKGDNSRYFGTLPHSRKVTTAVHEGEQIFGEAFGRGITSSLSIDWELIPNIGGMDAVLPPGRQRVIADRYGRVVVAGDWMSSAPSWIHGALESAGSATETARTGVREGWK